jgi:anaerobic magnesium-protoporphyrin IX monomethyl ester cyclase
MVAGGFAERTPYVRTSPVTCARVRLNWGMGMRIALISTYAHPIALGMRYVSAVLKAAGHDLKTLLMSSRCDTTKPDWSAAAVDAMIEHLRDRDLIGLSLMTNSFHRACVLTRRIRDAGLRAPIIWGGTHPTVAPDECLAIADCICMGEGENVTLELIRRLETGGDPLTVPSLAFRADGAFGNRQPIRNAIAALEADLDRFPFPDWDFSTQWVAAADGLRPARPENLRGALDTLRVETSRGCPFHCAFCNNAALQNLHQGCGKWTRLRSIENVLAELRQARSRFPTVRSINFVDDLFLVRREEELEEFAAKYKEQIGLPLQLDAFPNTVTERKVAALARLQIALVSMGIESASPDTLENIYLRPTPLKRIADAIALFKKYHIRTEYHYLVSNPFEPQRNVIETMRFIADYHRGRAVLRVFPLMFYPGTPLYKRARREGLIADRDVAAYDYMGTGALQFARHDYLAIWLRVVLSLRNCGAPSWLAHRVIDLAISRPVRALLDRRWFCPSVFVGYVVGRKLWRNLVYQPFVRPFKYLRGRTRGELRMECVRRRKFHCIRELGSKVPR